MSITTSLREWVEFAEGLADAASVVSLRYFRAPLKIDVKADHVSNMATVADRECEEAMVSLIKKEMPQFGIVREEGECIPTKNGYSWILDPIDGTASFVAGRPIWGTLIGLIDPSNTPIVGVVDQPFLKERYLGVHGRRTRLNGREITANSGTDLRQTILLRTTPAMFVTEYERKVSDLVSAACGSKAVWGGDCYSYASVAAGYGPPSVILESDLKYFDFAALIPIIKGAGGEITNWQGKSLGPSDTNVLATSNPALHNEILDRVSTIR